MKLHSFLLALVVALTTMLVLASSALAGLPWDQLIATKR
jgi:hypothetical protein